MNAKEGCPCEVEEIAGMIPRRGGQVLGPSRVDLQNSGVRISPSHKIA